MAENRPSSASPPSTSAPMTFSDTSSSLQHVVRSLPAPVALMGPSLQLWAWSPAWERLAGTALTAEQAPTFFDLFADQPDWRTRIERGLSGEADRGTAALLRHADGSECWVDWDVQPWRREADGPVTGVLLCLHDRTPQQRAEDRFRALADTVDEGVLLMDRSGVFQMCNTRAEEILGRPADRIVGSSVRDVQWRGLREDGSPLPNESFPFWVARYTGEPVRNRVMGIYPAEGPPRWIQVSAQPLCLNRDDDPYAVLASFADITEQKLSEEALRASKDMLSSVLVSSLDGIMVFSAVRNEEGEVADFEWLLANPKAGELVGRPADELMDQRLLDVFPGHREDGLFDDYVSVVETGEPLERELYYDHEGIEAWWQVIAVQLSDGVAVTLRDITERKEATQTMAATNAELEQRNQTLREFAYIASHDLQEPLRKISAFADLMREDYQDAVDETGEYYLERMQDAAERMSTLINDLLAYSRVTTQTESFETVDLNTILDNVRSDLEIRIREVGGRVEAEELPHIQADATQMRQLLQNLISNALKFHREGVPPVVNVSARIEQAEAPIDELDEPEPAEVCRLVVSDNGIGIEEKYADRIFTPFKRLYSRSQYEGTGMGLAICQRIAQRHGGRIELTSTPGPGSTFTITLPTTQESGTEASLQRAPSTDLDT